MCKLYIEVILKNWNKDFSISKKCFTKTKNDQMIVIYIQFISLKLTCLLSIAQFTVNIAGNDFNVLVCNVC